MAGGVQLDRRLCEVELLGCHVPHFGAVGSRVGFNRPSSSFGSSIPDKEMFSAETEQGLRGFEVGIGLLEQRFYGGGYSQLESIKPPPISSRRLQKRILAAHQKQLT